MNNADYRKLQPKALTMLEMVIALAIMAVIFAVMLPQFTNIQNSWASKQGNSEVIQNGRVLTDYLNRNLAKAIRITAVSGPAETSGYIEFEAADGITYRCDIAANNYVEFGPVGSLSDLAGPVTKLQFTCYALDDLDTPLTDPVDVDTVRFVKVESTLTNTNSMGQDKTFIACAYLRANSANGGLAVTKEPSSEYEFDGITAESPDLCQIDNTHYLCAYAGDAGDGWAVVLTVNPATWTVSSQTPFEFDTEQGKWPALCRIDSTHYLCAYTGDGNDGWAVVLTVNAGSWTITKQTPFEFDGQQCSTPALAKIDDEHYLLAYSDKFSDGQAVVLTVDTSFWTITDETPFEFDTQQATTPVLAKIDNQHYLCAYSDKFSDGRAVVLTVDTASWTVSSQTPLEFDTTQAIAPDLVQIDGTHYLCVYSGVQKDGWAVVLIVNNSTWTITKATALEFDSDEGQYPCIANIDGERFLCGYQGPNSDGWSNILTVDTGTWAIIADTAFEYDPVSGITPALASLDDTHFLCVYQGAGNDGWACILNSASPILP